MNKSRGELFIFSIFFQFKAHHDVKILEKEVTGVMAMQMTKTLFFLTVLLPIASYAADKTFLCDAPQGTRIDYFSSNAINLQNDTFIMGRDRVSGMRPKIVMNDNNKDVAFIIGDASEAASQPKMGNMKVLIYNEDQISFTGLVNGAPILATFYPKMNILIYSQQSIWPGTDYQGARAVIFYTKCTISQ